jgi:hypothetical protein
MALHLEKSGRFKTLLMANTYYLIHHHLKAHTVSTGLFHSGLGKRALTTVPAKVLLNIVTLVKYNYFSLVHNLAFLWIGCIIFNWMLNQSCSSRSSIDSHSWSIRGAVVTNNIAKKPYSICIAPSFQLLLGDRSYK